ncbi:thermonuclease family protein [Cryobacterium roopkundense]|uniref:Micrococcal nuclease n=1 Tax=Cryobacterium roopkundense TaxID=1001240 RepID=A0A7W9E288_9MICO|nr:thermonuclease family protein [Cryobacterium roopkundense]MBB5639891.1 micrococcal nuclease [Cryobacterium roopkundense]
MTVASAQSSSRKPRSIRFVIAAILVLALVVTVGVVLNTSPARAAEPVRAVVVRVIDGDTVVMTVKGKATRVRLLNVDTPETKDPGEPVECLGPEASAFLTALLPQGTKVTLKYDYDRVDRYGRMLAAVFIADGTFVSEEIAKNGFGMAVKFGDNTAYYETVRAAQKTAELLRRGLYSDAVECTVPAQMKPLTVELAAVAAAISATAPSAEVTALLARSAALVAAIAALQHMADLDGPSISMAIMLKTPKLKYAQNLQTLSSKAVALQSVLTLAEARAVAQEAAAAQAAAAAAAAAAQAAAEAQAAAVRAAAQAEADAAARAARSAPAPYVTPDVPYVAPPSSGGGDTYTGCRAYGSNGTSVDNQGRRYTKIPC